MAKATKIEYDVGTVMYVDGGCRPGYPGEHISQYGGWGIHGYTYPIGKTPKTLRTKKDVQTVKGYLVGETVNLEDQVVVDGYIDGFGSMGDKDTNNKAELTGMYNALKLVEDKGYKQAHFLLDSQYVLKGMTEYFPKWVENGWKKQDGSSYQNQDLWYNLMGLYEPLKEKVNISMEWVNGHSGNLGNDRADYLATKGVFIGRNGQLDFSKINESGISHYRKPSPEINRLLSKHRYYFNTNYDEPMKDLTGRYVYHCGAHGPDDTLVGKPISDSVACVAFLKEQVVPLEQIRIRHRELCENPYDHLCLMHLETVLLPTVYDELLKDGVGILSKANRRQGYEGLCTIDGQQVTKVIYPSGLTFKLIDVHNFLHTLYNRYKLGEVSKVDITDTFYKTQTEIVKKKEVEVTRCILQPAMKSIKLNLDIEALDKFPEVTYPTILTTGIDFPSRETLNAIAHRNPTVYLLTWRYSEHAYKIACVIECEEDSLIWMGKDCNTRMIIPQNIVRKK